MKFKIRRTSLYGDEEKPCEYEGVYKETFISDNGNEYVRLVC